MVGYLLPGESPQLFFCKSPQLLPGESLQLLACVTPQLCPCESPQPLALIFTRGKRSNAGVDELVAQIKKLEGITAVFVETKTVALCLLVIWLGMDYLDNSLEAAKPRWPRSIQIDQKLVVLAWCSVGANCHWL